MKLTEANIFKPLTIRRFDDLVDSSPPPRELFPDPSPLKEDEWGFGFMWYEIIQKFSSIEQLYDAIYDIYQSNRQTKEKYRILAQYFTDLHLEPNENRGVSGSYFAVDETGHRLYVIKPLDEDAGCIHSQGWATPFLDSPLRKNMPLYYSSMREVLAYEIAQLIGLESIVPKTVLAIIESEQFHDLSEGVSADEKKRFWETLGDVDTEKLCSVQEYVQNSKSLFEAIQDLQQAGLSDEEIANRFDQADFEDANILLWTTYDTDGHLGNFLVYPKGFDAIGNEILGIKKIDNGLAFPEKNQSLRNSLSYLPNANRELSEAAKAKIQAIDLNALKAKFEKLGLDFAIPALLERIGKLQELAQQPNMTIKELNTAMTKIGKKS